MNCIKSPSGDHQYDLNRYGRDDQGFYLDCIHCGHTSFFNCDTEDELFQVFGLNDDDDPDDFYEEE